MSSEHVQPPTLAESSAPTPGALAGPRGAGAAAEGSAGGSPEEQGSRRLIRATPASDESPARAGVLRHRHFRNVWMAALVSNTGNWMEMVGIQMVVAHETRSLKMMGYLAAAQLIPILLLGTAGGLVADRVNRKKLLLLTQAMLMALAGVVALVSWSGVGPPPIGRLLGIESDLVATLMVISALQGSVMAFNMPGWQTLTPRLVPREELTKAITLNGVQFNLARVIGPGIAGAIMGWYGATPLFVVNAASFVAVLVAISWTPDAPAPARTDEHPWAQVRRALAWVFRQRGPRAVFFAMVVMSMLASPLVRLLPLYCLDVYGLAEGPADRVTGWLLSALGVGAVLGGLSLRWIPAWYPKHHFIPLSLASAGAAILLFSLTRQPWQGLLVMVPLGVTWIFGFNQAWAALQHLVPDEMRGRVMAVANVASFGVTAIGNVASGWIGDALKDSANPATYGPATQAAIGSLAALLFLYGLATLIRRTPEIDGIEPGHPEYGPQRSLIDGVTARAHRPKRTGQCPECGYDLGRAGGPRCPECGRERPGVTAGANERFRERA